MRRLTCARVQRCWRGSRVGDLTWIKPHVESAHVGLVRLCQDGKDGCLRWGRGGTSSTSIFFAAKEQSRMGGIVRGALEDYAVEDEFAVVTLRAAVVPGW